MKLREYNLEDTIFAPITSILGGSVCIFRVSGINAKKIFNYTQISSPLSSRTYFTKLRDKNGLLDEILVTYFQSPKSFTGEDCIEISLHAGKYIIESFSELCTKIGFRLANPGEFSYRAILNNKIDLTQAESIKNLIDSTTKARHQLAIRGLSGETGQKYKLWHKKLREIIALIEANIDFSDQAIPLNYGLIYTKITDLQEEMRNILNKGKFSSQISSGFNIAILGAPNVGKSSLLNILTKKNSSIISSIPGTTRDIIEVKMDICGFPVNIFDTAGIRKNPQDEIEEEGIRRGIETIKIADMRLFVLDHNFDTEIIERFSQKDDIIIINKIDLFASQLDQNKLDRLDRFNIEIVKISAKNNLYINELIDLISQKITNRMGDIKDNILLSHRQQTLLTLCLETLNNIDLSDNIEIVAENLRMAISYLDEIFGVTKVDDILGDIFSKFCVGK